MVAFLNITYSQQITTPYDFPIKPGTSEWRNFQTHGEMLSACQIPVDLVKNMSSDALAKTCLEYPLFIDMIAYSSFKEGIERVIQQFNGLKEFMGRKDAGKSLLSLYLHDSAFKQDRMAKGSYFEMLLSCDDIMNNLTKEDKKVLLKNSLRKYKERRMQPKVYGSATLASTGLILGKLMKDKNFRLAPEINAFIEKGNIIDLETLDKIYVLASKTDTE
jgi:hypothetical protein